MLLRRHRDEQGSALILGLGIMAVLIIPLVAILTFASRTTSASVTANGLSIISAHSAVTRFIDPQATGTSQQVQLYTPGSNAAKAASNDVNSATLVAWDYSHVGGGSDTSLSMVTTDSRNVRRLDTPSNNDTGLVVGVMNLAGTPGANYSRANAQTGAGCRVVGGAMYQTLPNADTGTTAIPYCWVDHLAMNGDFSATTNRYPDKWGSNTDAQQQWDHYTSGAETLLRLDMAAPWPFNKSVSSLSFYFPGVATFSQNCAVKTDKCYQ